MVTFIRISLIWCPTTQSGVQKELRIQTTVSSDNSTIYTHICAEEQDPTISSMDSIKHHSLDGILHGSPCNVQSFQYKFSNSIQL